MFHSKTLCEDGCVDKIEQHGENGNALTPVLKQKKQVCHHLIFKIEIDSMYFKGVHHGYCKTDHHFCGHCDRDEAQ